MSKRAITIGLVVILAAVVVAPVWAGGEATISCTVTPRLIAVSVDPNYVDYGVVDLGSSAVSWEFTATNVGSAPEDFTIMGAGTQAWTLIDTTPDPNQYMHEFAKPTYPAGGAHDGWTALTATYQPLAAAVAANGGYQNFKLQIWTPTSTSSYDEQTTSVTVMAVEAG